MSTPKHRILLPLLLLAACGEGPTGRPQCSVTDDCPPGQTCLSGRCVPRPDGAGSPRADGAVNPDAGQPDVNPADRPDAETRRDARPTDPDGGGRDGGGTTFVDGGDAAGQPQDDGGPQPDDTGSACEPVDERCDGLDNDCDGEIDETFPDLGAPCESGVGACLSRGARVCRADGMGTECGAQARAPRPEICDGLDNDCDGEADEAIAEACYLGLPGTANVGECRIGTLSCADGVAEGCDRQIAPRAERCDGLDNDCDGQTDEDLPGVPCYDGNPTDLGHPATACRSGVRPCMAGVLGRCVDQRLPSPSGHDICNQVDDDCDGSIDEDCACQPGAPCDGPSEGECSPGIQVCAGDDLLRCDQRSTPTPELCNGRDDDCDGRIDNDADLPCYGGADGTAGVGACTTGVQICDRRTGALGDVCEGHVIPAEERCDGVDNDCDGETDEGFGELGVPCSVGIGGCERRGIFICAPTGDASVCSVTPGLPQAERCNDADDDCDGIVDEEAGEPCFEGPPSAVGTGACRAGRRACVNGTLGRCVDSVEPGDELCDGPRMDEDCDGAANEDCPCDPGETRPCGSSQGECRPGEQRCVGGAWGPCQGGASARAELCNGLDDNCDGQIDEDFERRADLGLPCTAGVGACAAPGRVVCTDNGGGTRCDAQPSAPQREICDGRDNDCDGQIDEVDTEQPMSCYGGPPGTAGVGVCRAGVAGCALGQPAACDGEVRPGREICDGLDNDCDGLVDEALAPEPCYEGDPAETRWPDAICARGARHCVNGEMGRCEDAVGPAPDGADFCNGADDDCDGQTDEDCRCDPGARCAGETRGACEPGTQICQGAALTLCAGRVEPHPEACNGIDDDCDGETDDPDETAVPCYNAAPVTLGIGVCRAGTRRCDTVAGRVEVECRGAIAPSEERCDGLDNNCNGRVDEAFPELGQLCETGQGTCRAHGRWVCAPDGAGTRCAAEPGEPRGEICNGQDDDCDGEIDEIDESGGPAGAMTRTCYDGPAGTDGVGLCRAGAQSCADGALGPCEGEIGPQSEICDDRDADEDCDGSIDEGCECIDGDARSCGTDQGACRQGLQSCDQGRWTECHDEIGPRPEQCNGLDDDCDGETDERFPDVGMLCTAGVGACEAVGRIVCAEDPTRTVCDARPGAPQAEICDGVDNDCDGAIDETLFEACYDGPAGTAGVGRCRAGEIRCAQGEMTVCAGIVRPIAEICDGADNDCNGRVDDEITPVPCYDGDPAELDRPNGICRSGERTCRDGALGQCEGEIRAAPQGVDDCNGLDDDCDGQTDEDCQCRGGEPCRGRAVGACQPGAQVCDGDRLVTCQGRVDGQPETCNGADDDCDGETDEDADVGCYPGLPATVGVGLCRAGVHRCDRLAAQLGARCEGAVTPAPERCDGLDNDCDGQIDEDHSELGQPCTAGEGACRGHGVWRCAPDGGALVCSAEPGQPRGERCNGLDDDCDGAIDEESDRICYSGAPDTVGIGGCRAGMQRCMAGVLGPCEGDALPRAEICDDRGQDEDCDGSTDEGCACVDGVTQDCGVDQGICRAGRQTCADGRLGSCEGAVEPSRERCNGLDDDCDGLVDQTFADLGAACSVGIGACGAEGRVVCDESGGGTRCDARARRPQGEICDGLDNDCDGQIDEALAGTCYDGPPGTAGVGICRAGRSGCTFGVPTACDGEIRPELETCDGQDNDCDGIVDQGVTPLPCYDGDPRELDRPRTACRAGEQACINGQPGACLGEIRAAPQGTDLCNGLDDDCDGEIDEDCRCRPGEPCAGEARGACTPGTQICDGDALTRCVNRVDPEPEICNGVDDDCDGDTDESADLVCYLGPLGTQGVGACRAGIRRCNRATGQLARTCADEITPGPERCDGFDNDCDGQIDEDFGPLGQPCFEGAGACRAAGIWRCSADNDGLTCAAQTGEPRAETCNGIDDDCDGEIDERTDRSCYAGPAGSADVGPCRAGQQRCVDGALGPCDGEVLPDAERCDNDRRDEDCDGSANEGCACNDGDIHSCGINRGACRAGRQSCEGGRWGICVDDVPARPELCNGIDDDCDGDIDEAFADLGLRCTAGAGACQASGRHVCAESQDGTRCDAVPAAPQPEICDGRDNDCNGQIDEALDQRCYTGPLGSAGVGQCRAGQSHCTDGESTVCDAEILPGPEICDGVDNDCNGRVDDDVAPEPCYDGDPSDLEWPDTVCRAGVRRCVDGERAPCTDQIRPIGIAQDRCNGLDDDCDGETDEDCRCQPGALCSGEGRGQCEPGVQICDGDRLLECDERIEPTPETCNGLDDDCDGVADEDADAPCYTGPVGTDGVGACQSGIRRCNRETGQLAAACIGETRPAAAERCDGIDNDCDGLVDESFAQLGEACNVGEGACRAQGRWRCAADGVRVACAAEPGIARVEICNRVDDDCDGLIDEDTERACYAGPADTLGVGLCHAGTQRCVNGALEACRNQVIPGVESCDGERRDEDCDGGFNEGCVCENGATQPCGANLGQCRPGEQLCVDGRWGDCEGASASSPERCNGIDDDCDGVIDNPFVDLGSICSAGVGVCRAEGTLVCADDGRSTTCDARPRAPQAEICDGRDNDCDGEIDDDVVSTCYFGPPGSAGIGVCRAGSARCASGELGLCSGEVGPTDEICDGLDNDCDGVVDEEVPELACYDGDPAHLEPPATACRAGARRCRNGELGPCVGQIGPADRDLCDGIDNDCDGAVDEDCQCRAGVPCVGESRGICDPGVQVCDERGLLDCADRVVPEPERCNGLDDDCDGVVDNDAHVPCYSGSAATEGIGQCRAGVRRCDRASGRPDAACEGEIAPVAERCDGLDNDCDGQIDEDFPDVGTRCAQGVGACAQQGVWVCQGAHLRCDADPGLPRPEICNAIDDDCDGQIDEDADRICYGGPQGTRDVGQCRSGVQRCAAGALGLCEGEIRPAAELCDEMALDENCDGSGNERCDCREGQARPCGLSIGACEPGRQICAHGAWSPCEEAVGPQAERCNGQDDDCDGEIDEGFADLGAACTRGQGICRAAGAQICADDGLTTRCEAEPGSPAPEICDGRDNNCDGLTDENIVVECYRGPAGTAGVGECRAGAALCVDGALDACEGDVTPVPDRCDGLDNDCDGEIDEDLPIWSCYDGDPAELQVDQTTCRAGTRRCTDGVDGPCDGQVLPRPDGADHCNDLDDDCDGEIDEDCRCRPGVPCLGESVGACAPGVQICDAHGLVRCEGRIDPVDETCNGVDDDCDGAVDEDTDEICYAGPSGTDGIGQCRAGVRRCDHARGELEAACDGEIIPQIERCDGHDNDCDGRVDEGFDGVGEACVVGTGACQRAAVVICGADGAGVHCPVEAGRPEPERCDGADNDCDGEIDEPAEAQRACYSGPPGTAGVGRCQTGQQRCFGGALGHCEGEITPEAEEICDDRAIDEDCDGSANEGCECADGDSRACGSAQGNCERGVQTCNRGTWSACDAAVMPADEICNGQDDDCDGQIDEPFPNVGTECSVGTGRCRVAGRRVCAADGQATFCDARPGDPMLEICNGQDDDCDGQIDEPQEANLPCYFGPAGTAGVGTCRPGVQVCALGNLGACAQEIRPAPEICDGLDNDCDGIVDDDLPEAPCYDGDPAELAWDRTACRSGRERCVDGEPGICDGQVRPAPAGTDDCNDLDDDCDGEVDEDCACRPGQPCEGRAAGQCDPGVQVCDAQGLVECAGRVDAGLEICDQVDNDCDGQVDEEPESNATCYSGPPATRGVGRCRAGVRTCDRITGRLDPVCDGEITPSPERCDGIDNDCDDRVDEAFPDLRNPCQIGVGACATAGIWQCTADGAGVICAAGVGDPRREICNGADDDCDGEIDEPEETDQICYSGAAGTAGIGVCREGIQRCVDGRLGPCEGEILPGLERCDPDNRDESCDGAANEGCDCNHGAERPCGADTGLCTPGLQTCVDGAWGECIGAVGPAAEQCNGVDDDCDGETDEALPAEPCYSGPAGTEGIGVCRSGYRECRNGRQSACLEQVRPALVDDCSGLDEDCDGQTDEDYAPHPTSCGRGECRNAAETACLGGEVVDTCVPHPADAELCGTGRDEDCDGEIDERFDVGQPCGSGLGVCQRSGQLECTPDRLGTVCSAQPGEAAPERCGTDLDEDCDGLTDEGFAAVNEPCVEGTGACRAEGVNRCSEDGLSMRCSGVPGEPGDELCGTHEDEDCDGQIDEGFDNGLPCTAGVGACQAAGLFQCRPDRLGVECGAIVGEAGQELCATGVDEDCDGEVDEGFPAGQPCRVGAGACEVLGTFVCSPDRLAIECDAQPLPPAANDATCDRADEDCNGLVDDGFVGRPTTCGRGVCAASGREICIDGVVDDGCEPGEPVGNDDDCNGLDDDCDGTVDDAFVPLDEICDGIDNDCDGSIDTIDGEALTCAVAGATGPCVAGRCVYEQCDERWFDDDNDLTNGCERGCAPPANPRPVVPLPPRWDEAPGGDTDGISVAAAAASFGAIRLVVVNLFNLGRFNVIALSSDTSSLAWPSVVINGATVVVAAQTDDGQGNHGISVFTVTRDTENPEPVPLPIQGDDPRPGRPILAQPLSADSNEVAIVYTQSQGADGPRTLYGAFFEIDGGPIRPVVHRLGADADYDSVRPTIQVVDGRYVALVPTIGAESRLRYVRFDALGQLHAGSGSIGGLGARPDGYLGSALAGDQLVVAAVSTDPPSVVSLPIDVGNAAAPIFGQTAVRAVPGEVYAHPDVAGGPDDFLVFYTLALGNAPTESVVEFLRWTDPGGPLLQTVGGPIQAVAPPADGQTSRLQVRPVLERWGGIWLGESPTTGSMLNIEFLTCQ